MCHYLLHYLWIQNDVSVRRDPFPRACLVNSFSLHLLIKLPTHISLAVPSHNHIVTEVSAVCGRGCKESVSEIINPNVLITAHFPLSESRYFWWEFFLCVGVCADVRENLCTHGNYLKEVRGQKGSRSQVREEVQFGRETLLACRCLLCLLF